MTESTGERLADLVKETTAQGLNPEVSLDLSWTGILEMFEAYLTTWETGEPTPPFPADPDGGELRILGALRSLVDAAMSAEDQGVHSLSTEYIRRHLSRKLIER